MGDMAQKAVLIVHDDPDMITALRLSLESAGYRVTSAEHNHQALEQILAAPPDLVIVDVAIEMASDPQVALSLRNPAARSPYKDYRRIPILMLVPSQTTASLRDGREEDYFPVDDTLAKPVDPDDLLNKVRVLIRTAAGG